MYGFTIKYGFAYIVDASGNIFKCSIGVDYLSIITVFNCALDGYGDAAIMWYSGYFWAVNDGPTLMKLDLVP